MYAPVVVLLSAPVSVISAVGHISGWFEKGKPKITPSLKLIAMLVGSQLCSKLSVSGRSYIEVPRLERVSNSA